MVRLESSGNCYNIGKAKCTGWPACSGLAWPILLPPSISLRYSAALASKCFSKILREACMFHRVTSEVNRLTKPPMYLFTIIHKRVVTNGGVPRSSIPLQAVWNQKLNSSGHDHSQDMVFDGLEIFLVLRKPCANHGEASTASNHRVCEIEAVDGAFCLLSISCRCTQRDIRLTTILELEGPDLRKNSMIHRRSILI